ncbi:DUF488 family protein [Clostridium hydrogenum]|uniref:DUF488 family protein n=1 Tax=Clostridium hydrogenum TaxID=2855764 RepID=UPI001F3B62BE|nr:DUF488 family protein [Clostridium hydrogenum]
MKKICYTIGHGDIEFNDFISILKVYKINCVIDIRGEIDCLEKYKHNNIKALLNDIGIYYIPMQQEFNLKTINEDGAVDFEKVRCSDNFNKGISRIENGLTKGFNIAIMGSEIEPVNCNRGIIIAYVLKKREVEVRHIINKEVIKNQEDIESELLKMYGVKLIKMVAELSINSIKKNVDLDMNENDFRNEMIEEAYRIRNREICLKCCKM